MPEPKATPHPEPEAESRKARIGAEGVFVEIDPDRIEEAVTRLTEELRRLVTQGRYTKVRLKYRGKPLMPDIPMGVLLATEAVTFWYAGLLRALVVNLGMRTIIEVELIHDADERVRQGNELFMEGEIEAAEERYREALRMKPDDPAALYHLGVLLRVSGRRAEAMAALEKAAAAEHPDAERAREALEKLRRGPRSL